MKKIAITSVYANPLHPGHIECFELSRELADELIVIVNNDHQARLKRGTESFQDEQYRLKLVESLRPVTRAVPSHAVRHTEGGHEALVGCLGWNCAESGADLMGRWMPPGVVQRVPSPIELALAGFDGEGPNVVVVGDTHNYPASVSLHPVRK